MFGIGKKNAAKEAERNRKVVESQNALLAAAIATADMAQDVTTGLKKRLDDIVQQFESTARILRDGLIICNARGTVQTFNPAAERMFGVEAKDVLKKSVLALFEGAEEPIRDVPHLWSLLQNDDEDDILGRNGDKTFQARISFSALDRSDGSTAMLLLVHDAPVQSSAHGQAVFETSFDGIVVVLSEDGSLVAANPAITRMFGYPAETLMGKPVSMLVSPKDQERINACRPRTGEDSALPQHFAVEGVHSSGRLLNLVFTLAQIQWEGKNSVLATIKDVTELRRLENMVAMKRDNGIDMVCCYDPTFRVTFVNQTFARSMGMKRKDAVGLDVRDLMEADDRETFLEAVASLSPATPATRTQVQRADTNGREIIQDWIDHATFDADGNPVEYQRVGRDIADAVQAVKSRV